MIETTKQTQKLKSYMHIPGYGESAYVGRAYGGGHRGYTVVVAMVGGNGGGYGGGQVVTTAVMVVATVVMAIVAMYGGGAHISGIQNKLKLWVKLAMLKLAVLKLKVF
jgi:uncharacterized membrane protein